MFIQHVLKGVTGIDEATADAILRNAGLQCNWWRRVGSIPADQIITKLNEDALDWHLSRYEETDPATGSPFADNTPFISTSAGTVERDAFQQRNLIYPPFLTALRFATAGFTQPGYIFYGYVFVLGKKAVELMEFAEETRDLHLYTAYQPYHPEGELVAKIWIPPTRLEKYEQYDGPQALRELRRRKRPAPARVSAPNAIYQAPERFHNIRPVVG
jgi:hypothetical protein